MPVLARDVRYVAVDFERDDLGAALAAAGHDPNAPTATVWEGVTMYLERPALEATLAVLGRVSASGSALLVTYYDVVGPRGARLFRPIFAVIGEPLVTQLARDEMRALLDV